MCAKTLCRDSLESREHSTLAVKHSTCEGMFADLELKKDVTKDDNCVLNTVWLSEIRDGPEN